MFRREKRQRAPRPLPEDKGEVKRSRVEHRLFAGKGGKTFPRARWRNRGGKCQWEGNRPFCSAVKKGETR